MLKMSTLKLAMRMRIRLIAIGAQCGLCRVPQGFYCVRLISSGKIESDKFTSLIRQLTINLVLNIWVEGGMCHPFAVLDLIIDIINPGRPESAANLTWRVCTNTELLTIRKFNHGICHRFPFDFIKILTQGRTWTTLSVMTNYMEPHFSG